MECRSADVEELKGSYCRLKKIYRKWQRNSDERKTVRYMVVELMTFELVTSGLQVCL